MTFWLSKQAWKKFMSFGSIEIKKTRGGYYYRLGWKLPKG